MSRLCRWLSALASCRVATASSTDGSVSPKRIGPRTAAAAAAAGAEPEAADKKNVLTSVLATAAEQDFGDWVLQEAKAALKVCEKLERA